MGMLHSARTCVVAEVWTTCQSSGLLAASASRLAASSSTTAEGCSVQRAAAATLIAPPGPCMECQRGAAHSGACTRKGGIRAGGIRRGAAGASDWAMVQYSTKGLAHQGAAGRGRARRQGTGGSLLGKAAVTHYESGQGSRLHERHAPIAARRLAQHALPAPAQTAAALSAFDPRGTHSRALPTSASAHLVHGQGGPGKGGEGRGQLCDCPGGRVDEGQGGVCMAGRAGLQHARKAGASIKAGAGAAGWAGGHPWGERTGRCATAQLTKPSAPGAGG